MQRFVLLAIVGFCLAAYATGNDLEIGERQEGDVLVARRLLHRPAVPGKRMIAKSGMGSDGVITHVSAKNAPGSDATVTLAKGGVGTPFVLVTAIGEPGQGIDVELEIYALEATTITEQAIEDDVAA